MSLFRFLTTLQTLQVCLCWDFHQYQGPVSTPIPQDCYDSLMNADGSYFYCSNYYDRNLKIFKNNGSGFSLFQTLNVSLHAMALSLEDNGAHLAMAAQTFIYIYQETSNGTYERIHLIDAGS